MRIYISLILIVILLAPFNLAHSNDVYFINLKKVLNESKAGSDAQSKLLKEFQSKDKKFKGESDALKKQETELITQKKTLSSEDYIRFIGRCRQEPLARSYFPATQTRTTWKRTIWRERYRLRVPCSMLRGFCYNYELPVSLKWFAILHRRLTACLGRST